MIWIISIIVFSVFAIFLSCALAGANGKDEEEQETKQDQIQREKLEDARRTVAHMGYDPDSPTGGNFVQKYLDIFNNEEE